MWPLELTGFPDLDANLIRFRAKLAILNEKLLTYLICHCHHRQPPLRFEFPCKENQKTDAILLRFWTLWELSTLHKAGYNCPDNDA